MPRPPTHYHFRPQFVEVQVGKTLTVGNLACDFACPVQMWRFAIRHCAPPNACVWDLLGGSASLSAAASLEGCPHVVYVDHDHDMHTLGMHRLTQLQQNLAIMYNRYLTALARLKEKLDAELKENEEAGEGDQGDNSEDEEDEEPQDETQADEAASQVGQCESSMEVAAIIMNKDGTPHRRNILHQPPMPMPPPDDATDDTNETQVASQTKPKALKGALKNMKSEAELLAYFNDALWRLFK